MSPQKPVLKSLVIFGGIMSACALCCLAPALIATFGGASLLAISGYVDKTMLILLVLITLAIYWRAKRKPSCKLDCECKNQTQD